MRMWECEDGRLMTDGQLLAYVATLGGLRAAADAGDVTLLSEGRAAPPREPGGARRGLVDFLDEE